MHLTCYSLRVADGVGGGLAPSSSSRSGSGRRAGEERDCCCGLLSLNCCKACTIVSARLCTWHVRLISTPTRSTFVFPQVATWYLRTLPIYDNFLVVYNSSFRTAVHVYENQALLIRQRALSSPPRLPPLRKTPTSPPASCGLFSGLALPRCYCCRPELLTLVLSFLLYL